MRKILLLALLVSLLLPIWGILIAEGNTNTRAMTVESARKIMFPHEVTVPFDIQVQYTEKVPYDVYIQVTKPIIVFERVNTLYTYNHISSTDFHVDYPNNIKLCWSTSNNVKLYCIFRNDDGWRIGSALDALPVGDEAAFQTTIQNLSKYFLYYKTSASSDNTTLILNGDKRDARDNYHTILYITNAPLILNCNYSYNGLVTETHTQYRDEIRYRIETRYKTETMYGHWYIN